MPHDTGQNGIIRSENKFFSAAAAGVQPPISGVRKRSSIGTVTLKKSPMTFAPPFGSGSA